MRRIHLRGAGLLCVLALLSASRPASSADTPNASLENQLPNESWITPFKDQIPIHFITRAQKADEWDKLAAFWNESSETVPDPRTGQSVQRKAVKIKVPLGLQSPPPVPVENPLTVAKWRLGKDLYFDNVLSSNDTVSCASCHDPNKGYTDRSPVSTGISGFKGGVSAPPVLNSAYNRLQFWDGRASSLEDQVQGPPQNALEMFDGKGHAWNKVVERVRKKGNYTARFRQVFGTEPTRDTLAKAIASYERLVLSGNSIYDRAELAMRQRVAEEETGKFEFKNADFEKVLKDAFAKKDVHALKALQLDPDKDAGKASEMAASINNGRALFFGKARCNSCHVGDNFTDNDFHNLGVGVKDGVLPESALGRYAAAPIGHKNPAHIGAFKTSGLRGLVGTGPYLHDGSEATLEKVVDFYDDGGRANEYLDVKMRDFEAEKAYLLSKANGKPYTGPEVKLFGKNQVPVVPLKLKLSPQEKKELVLFMRALEGDPVDAVVAVPYR